MQNAGAFTEALGVKQAPLVVWLSMINWNSDDRDMFIKAVTGKGASSASTSVSRR